MARFGYTAVDELGQSFTGDLEARNLAEARNSLLQHGLRVLSLSVIATRESAALTEGERLEIVCHLRAATENELPLIGSLQAFSEEVGSARMRRQLDRICADLETGMAITDALSKPGVRLPRVVSMVLSSGLPLPAMNHLLSSSVRTVSTAADLHMRAFMLLMYPTCMMLALAGFWLFLLLQVTPQFAELFADFGLEVSPVLLQFLNLSKLLTSVNWWLLVLVLLGLAALAILIHQSLSPVLRRRLWCGIPLVGSMYRLASLSEYSRLLAVMLESHVPLPQALKWVAVGVNDSELSDRTDAINERLLAGQDLVSATDEVPGLPPHMVQILRFAATGPEGAEPLRTLARLMETRARALSQIALPLLEPVVLIAAFVSIGIYVVAAFLPMIKLLNDLS